MNKNKFKVGMKVSYSGTESVFSSKARGIIEIVNEATLGIRFTPKSFVKGNIGHNFDQTGIGSYGWWIKKDDPQLKIITISLNDSQINNLNKFIENIKNIAG